MYRLVEIILSFIIVIVGMYALVLLLFVVG